MSLDKTVSDWSEYYDLKSIAQPLDKDLILGNNQVILGVTSTSLSECTLPTFIVGTRKHDEITKLEARISHLKGEIRELKEDIKELESKLKHSQSNENWMAENNEKLKGSLFKEQKLRSQYEAEASVFGEQLEFIKIEIGKEKFDKILSDLRKQKPITLAKDVKPTFADIKIEKEETRKFENKLPPMMLS